MIRDSGESSVKYMCALCNLLIVNKCAKCCLNILCKNLNTWDVKGWLQPSFQVSNFTSSLSLSNLMFQQRIFCLSSCVKKYLQSFHWWLLLHHSPCLLINYATNSPDSPCTLFSVSIVRDHPLIQTSNANTNTNTNT